MPHEIRRVTPARLAQWAEGNALHNLASHGLHCDKAVPPVGIRRALHLAPGVPAAQRTRHYTDPAGATVQIATSYIPLGYAGSWMWTADTGPGGIYARLAEAGHAPARYREELVARAPAREEAAVLGPGPVAEVVRVAYTADNRPVEAAHIVLAAARFTFVCETSLI